MEIAVVCRRRFPHRYFSALDLRHCFLYLATQKVCVSTPTATHPLIERLRDVAERDHLTQRQLAEQLGVSERTVSYWFTTDTMPQKRYRQALVQWLEAAA
jgi:AraC-like DNA-binding protein